MSACEKHGAQGGGASGLLKVVLAFEIRGFKSEICHALVFLNPCPGCGLPEKTWLPGERVFFLGFFPECLCVSRVTSVPMVFLTRLRSRSRSAFSRLSGGAWACLSAKREGELL